MQWPWQKFELLYDSYVKREQSEKAFQERTAYITGLLANTNLDDGKRTKATMLESVDIDYQNALKTIYNMIIEDDLDSPLFRAIKVPGRDDIPEQAADPENTTQELNRTKTDVDQGG